MSNGPNLWWIYDREAEKFSALPTGPLLVPVLMAIIIGSLLKGLIEAKNGIEFVAGPLKDTPYWQQKRDRYYSLIAKYTSTNGDLSASELQEFKQLEAYLCNPYRY